MRVLTRSWQMLLKALEELALAPNAMMAAEMAVIRLTHVADLPPPEDLVRRLTEQGTAAPGGGPGRAPKGGGGGGATALAVVPGEGTRPAPEPEPQDMPQAVLSCTALADALALIKPLDFRLHDQAETFLRLVRYRPGMIEFNPAPGAPADLAGRLGQVLRSATGARWAVLVSDEPGQPTIAEERRAAEEDAKREAENHPLIAAALATFPGATVSAVRPLTPPPEPEYLAAIPEDDDDAELLDDDDPFQEDM